MKSTLTGILIASAFVTASARAACEMPSLVAAIPDGATATEQELLAVQNEVREYVAAMDRYIACQNEELTARGANATDDYLFQMSTRVEAARNEVDAVASRFNDAVTAFRAAQQAAALPSRESNAPLRESSAPARDLSAPPRESNTPPR